jgi:hypothetical protein
MRIPEADSFFTENVVFDDVPSMLSGAMYSFSGGEMYSAPSSMHRLSFSSTTSMGFQEESVLSDLVAISIDEAGFGSSMQQGVDNSFFNMDDTCASTDATLNVTTGTLEDFGLGIPE